MKERRNTQVEQWSDTIAAGVGSLGWLKLGLEALKWRENLSLMEEEFVENGARSEILWPSQGAAAEKKRRFTGRVGGDTRLCLITSADKPQGTNNGGGERGRNGGAERHPE